MSASRKRCSRCRIAKPLTAFYKHAKRPQGLMDECIVCHKARDASRPSRAPIREGTKTCSTCGIEQARTAFTAAKANKDGLQGKCKACRNRTGAAWYAANLDKGRQSARAAEKRQRQNPAKREAKYAKTLAWKAANPARVQAHRDTDAAKAKTNPTRKASHAKANTKWFAKHPTYRRTASHKRRALIKGAEVLDADIDIERLYARDRGVCALCGKRVNKALKWPDLGCATIDHIIPLTKGGPHSWANVALAHHRCNSLKNNRSAIQQLRLF
jgi:5-methylcytosine-specific restriction endonuclease McrA